MALLLGRDTSCLEGCSILGGIKSGMLNLGKIGITEKANLNTVCESFYTRLVERRPFILNVGAPRAWAG